MIEAPAGGEAHSDAVSDVQQGAEHNVIDTKAKKQKSQQYAYSQVALFLRFRQLCTYLLSTSDAASVGEAQQGSEHKDIASKSKKPTL